MENKFVIDDVELGSDKPIYFIADIGANHDGILSRAIDLIHLAAQSGASAAKFQHFKAETIVSKHGFNSLDNIKSHQSSWKKSVFEVYKEASINPSWTPVLKEECDKAGIAFFTSPYSKEIVDEIDEYVPAYKIGSGDITWIELIEYIAAKNKPYILATGASVIDDVVRAVEAGLAINPNLCLMQCNTNYTGSMENFHHIHLNVLKLYKKLYPDLLLGLSDHTSGHATVLGAVALGARVIEKHFTDDCKRLGPDHSFAMDPSAWREMVDRSRELDLALGSEEKFIADNEKQTAILQRRALRVNRNINAGEKIISQYIESLRPCPEDGIPPYELNNIVEKRINRNLLEGDYIKWADLS